MSKKKVLCVDTGELFDSINTAAKSLNGHLNGLWKAIREGIKYHGKTFVKVDEPLQESESKMFRKTSFPSNQIIDMTTGKVYTSYTSASKHLNIPKSTLHRIVGQKERVNGHLYAEYSKLPIIEQKKTKKLSKLENKLAVQCVENRRKYGSISECARKLKCPVSWVSRAVYSGDTCMGKHYTLNYVGRNNKIKEEKIIDVTTNEIWETPRLCAGALKISEYNLRRAILKKEVVNGHYLEWLFIYNEDYTDEEKEALKGFGK